jgi:bifunctional non-homologous end joining protein LigD
VALLRARSRIIDGEAVACDNNGLASFDSHPLSAPGCQCVPLRLRPDRAERRRSAHDPLEVRKATLANVLAKAADGIRLSEHIEEDGPTVFRHACKLGLEGIVSKRRDSPYPSGRSPDWLKMKNPACEAVKREEEEDWASAPAPSPGASATGNF